jgi:hypothetical protein
VDKTIVTATKEESRELAEKENPPTPHSSTDTDGWGNESLAVVDDSIRNNESEHRSAVEEESPVAVSSEKTKEGMKELAAAVNETVGGSGYPKGSENHSSSSDHEKDVDQAPGADRTVDEQAATDGSDHAATSFHTPAPHNKPAGTPLSASTTDTPFATPAQGLLQKIDSEADAPSPSAALEQQQQQQQQQQQRALLEAQKEARTLRRSIVTLNSQLETAEKEVAAQRMELDHAAAQMEKERARYKEERDKEKARHVSELAQLKSQHERAMSEAKAQSEEQLEAVRKQVQELEQQRKQEGGDWNKELADALQRGKDMQRKCAMLEDERETLLSQISTLQEQQEALGSRLESLTNTADGALQREKEAEDRLDEALTIHARQISQRQAREAELEKTVTELGAALVAARKTGKNTGSNDNGKNATNDANSGGSHDDEDQSEHQKLKNENESLFAQLAHERERCEALQKEIREISLERTEEASVTHARQLQHDRRLSELIEKNALLETELRETKREIVRRDSTTSELDSEVKEYQNRIKSLSEELLRAREKMSSFSSEISALRTRLSVALNRATVAEAAAETPLRGNDSFDEMERAPDGGSRTIRRRRARDRKSDAPSMRGALQVDGVRGVGKSLDAIDVFLAKSGEVLRFNPVARLFFGKKPKVSLERVWMEDKNANLRRVHIQCFTFSCFIYGQVLC